MKFTAPLVSEETKQYALANKQKAQALFDEGKYKEVCDFVDGMFGWGPGELSRVYTRESAEFCLKQLH
jgi:hypothetical protein